MFTLLTVLRKHSNISTEKFRHFMEHEYGPIYAALPETLEYIHYYIAGATIDGVHSAIDAIVKISFASREDMRIALNSDTYRKAHALRQTYMREIQPNVVEKIVKLV